MIPSVWRSLFAMWPILALFLFTIYAKADTCPADKQPTYFVEKAKEIDVVGIRIDDPGLLKAISTELKTLFGTGFETNTVLVYTFAFPNGQTYIMEFDAVNCALPSGALPATAWRMVLDRVQP